MSDKKYTYSVDDDVERIMILADNWLHTWDVLGEGANPEPEKDRQEAYRNLKKAVEELSEKARPNNDDFKKQLGKPSYEPIAHMMPSDIERFKTEETFANAYSVAIANPREKSVPLYTQLPQQKPLSDDEILNLLDDEGIELPVNVRCKYELQIARAVEKALRIGAL